MTPDQTLLVDHLHRQVGHLAPRTPAPVDAGHVVKLINFLRMEERRAAVAEEKLRKILTKAAEEHLETLLTDA